MKTDNKAYQEIVKQYSRPLYMHIRRIVISHDDTEDVLQETFIRAYRHIWTLRDASALRPWLYRIATNEANRFLSRKHEGENITEVLEQKLTASEFINWDEEAELKLQKAMLQLSPQQKTVFSLRYYEEMSYEDIAKVTGSKPETLKVSYHYAKDKIVEYIKNH